MEPWGTPHERVENAEMESLIETAFEFFTIPAHAQPAEYQHADRIWLTALRRILIQGVATRDILQCLPNQIIDLLQQNINNNNFEKEEMQTFNEYLVQTLDHDLK